MKNLQSPMEILSPSKWRPKLTEQMKASEKSFQGCFIGLL